MMRAVTIVGRGGPEVFEVREVDEPEPGRGEVRVKVRAAGLNRADLLQGLGQYPAPPGVPADVPGLEFAGEVDAVGPGPLAPWTKGDRVYGLVGGGALAERVVVHGRELAAVPDGLSWAEAAAVPEAFLTSYDALITQGGLQTGQTVLIHGASGGIGTAAIQVARAAGAITIGTSRSDAARHALTGLGLDHLITTDGADFAPEAQRLAGGSGIDLIFDVLGARAWGGNVESVRPGGRIVLIGLLTGARTEVALGALLAKRVTLVATTMRSRPLEAKIALATVLAERIGPLLRHHRVRPVLDATYPLNEVRKALDHLNARPHLGKIIVTLEE
jgi:putative PIG3 family NAD(P)H quinone oxidoreductase